MQDESRARMLDSMARVWNKVQGTERAAYKQYVEMGDILCHETDGQRGRCGDYDGPPCMSWPDEREAAV